MARNHGRTRPRANAAILRAWLEAIPLPAPGDSRALDCLRYALGNALPAANRLAWPGLSKLREPRECVVEQQINKNAGVDVP